ncbi:restriction endonuclease subunit S [Candidatus Methylomirabilis limnetica]|uniref:Restriction endonuclease subunit S n=1 Tax=Candidatus Methylomirabilis limnetica TaxID=2033718 RepID=A0A2T4TZQ0_9BACT|nr:DEAD/DEAH box helicase family protein [Candidatus Methylomirabilis limnetica]PTL36597.1 restriction endonuclease subunit S [Candidatus Methylomirabilis limnetica]
MAKKKKALELTFQQHIADYLIREHKYGVLEQSDITDNEHFIAEDQLWAFLKASQADQLKKLVDDYGTDAREEVFKALRKELEYTPLWMLFRQGLKVRGLEFRLFYPKPRSAASAAAAKYAENRITFRPHFYFSDANHEIDFVFYLNGLPIVALELKHEANQNVEHAVAQFVARDHTHKIFQHPFLYLAVDTSEVKAATDPHREENFRWHNMGLTNTATNAAEYPVEFLYREVLSQGQLLEALSFFLVRVPEREAEDDKPARPASTIFPRYHQSRLVRRVAEDITAHFATAGDIGKKYLADHSAGSGKTLSICWLADRLHSLFRPDTNEKLVDITFILTDRKSLDTNIREDIDKFTHLKDVVGIAKKADDLPRFLKERKSIIVTTQQKFAWVLEEIQKNPELKKLRVAFLIDEAHRSQEGQMGAAIRLPFRKEGEPDEEAPDEDLEEQIAKVIREHDLNQLFVAFTATPAPATVSMFGKPFDSYTEAEAIAEGYIVDVAASIISYKTLYNLHCPIVPQPDEEKLYPKGVVSKALQNVAFQDDGLIQYKAEVMLRIFEKDVKPLIGGRAKAMIVTSSRVAGLRYFNIIKEKLKERGADYKVLYAFSDFVHPETNEAISEYAVNELQPAELIENRFEGDDYRIMVVANKFQTGFDQPLLAGMFLDKPVLDRNAVQTVSRLNRCYHGKKDVVVVDFTNNAKQILKAFAKYRKGTPFEPEEPDQETSPKLHTEILATGVFTQKDAADVLALLRSGTDAQVQFQVNALRMRFQAKLTGWEDRKAFVYLLARFVKSFHFLACFFTYSPQIQEFVTFAEWVGPQLIKVGTVSDLMKQIRATVVTKVAVQYQGVTTSGGPVKLQPGKGKGGAGPVPVKSSVQDMIAQILAKHQITDEEALYIKQVTEEKIADPAIRTTVQAHRDDRMYLEGPYRGQVNGDIQETYDARARYDELADPKYTDTGGIFDIMAVTVIQTHLSLAA